LLVLRKSAETLAGIYAGNPKRATARPTTEMMLKAFTGINLVEVNLGETRWHSVTPLYLARLKLTGSTAGTAWLEKRSISTAQRIMRFKPGF